MGVMKHGVRKPAGQTWRFSIDSDHVSELDTLQCIHCGMHWEYLPGSKRLRAWCTSCDGPLCCEKPNCSRGCERGDMHWERQQNRRVAEASKIILPGK